MSVYQVASGRWAAVLSVHRKKTALGTFDTEDEARAVHTAARAALPPEPYRPSYVLEDRGYTSPCWVWQRATATNGYGTIVVTENGRKQWKRAHRHYYERHVGPIPDGHQLDHLCRVRACVNPAHLEAVTQAENIRRGANAKLTAKDAAAIRASEEHPLHLARRYGVGENAIYRVRSGLTWGPDKRLTDLASREAA